MSEGLSLDQNEYDDFLSYRVMGERESKRHAYLINLLHLRGWEESQPDFWEEYSRVSGVMRRMGSRWRCRTFANRGDSHGDGAIAKVVKGDS